MTVDQERPWNIHMGDLFHADWKGTSKRVLVLSTTKACKENPTKYDEVVPVRGTDFGVEAEKQVLDETSETL